MKIKLVHEASYTYIYRYYAVCLYRYYAVCHAPISGLWLQIWGLKWR